MIPLPHMKLEKAKGTLEDMVWFDATMHIIHIAQHETQLFTGAICYAVLKIYANRKGEMSVIRALFSLLHDIECQIVGRLWGCRKK